jgi:hypothetical protein
MGDISLWINTAKNEYDGAKDGCIEGKEKQEYWSIKEIEKANQFFHSATSTEDNYSTKNRSQCDILNLPGEAVNREKHLLRGLKGNIY